jgi:transcriptional regulator with XRE-family HTH domain
VILTGEARKQRKIGKRQLARALQTSHGRVSALENTENLELKSITAVAAQLSFDVQVSLIPKDGGTSLNALLQTMK